METLLPKITKQEVAKLTVKVSLTRSPVLLSVMLYSHPGKNKESKKEHQGWNSKDF